MSNRTAKNLTYYRFLCRDEVVGSDRLLIPTFQRNYEWSKREVEPLIKSIDEYDINYYVGNIITQEASRDDLLVDGQQRLVTLSLILSALKEYITDNASLSKIDEILFRSGTTPRIKFSRRNLDTAYKKLLNGKDITFDAAQEKFYKNFQLIKKIIKPIEDKKSFLKKIFNLEFVAIRCENELDVHQLFESLNSKGKPLSAVQLTKNILLSKSRGRENYINKKWVEIQDLFEKNELIWFDKFLRHQWFSIEGYTSQNNLYSKIVRYINETSGAEDYTDQLYHDSKIYLALRKGYPSGLRIMNAIRPEAKKLVELIIPKIESLKLDQVYAVLLALIKYAKLNTNFLKSQTFPKVLQKLWYFLILIHFSRVSPSSYERKFADYCISIQGSGRNEFKNITNSFFEKLCLELPTETEFENRLINGIKCGNEKIRPNSRIPFNYDREIIRSLLSLYLTDGNYIDNRSRETIEHIIPQSKTIEKWPINSTHFNNIETVLRYRIGNLTLLTDDKIGDSNFEEKYEEGYQYSDHEKNVQLKDDYPEFGSTNPGRAVNKRGQEIAKSLYKILNDYLKKEL